MSGKSELVDRLAAHRTLGGAPRAELEWLADHGELQPIRLGEAITESDQVIRSLYVVLSGRFAIQVDHGYGPRKVMEWQGGDVGGLLPYSRLSKAPGEAVVHEAGEVLTVDGLHFQEMVVRCPWVTTTLVHVMLDRARVFTSSSLLDEKMASLGRLAAGLAHELNNPASAAARSASRLGDGLARAETAARALGAARLTAGQQAAVDEVRRVCVRDAPPILSAMERADREDALGSWLEARGLDADAAGALAGAGVSTETLDGLAAALPEAALGTAVDWIATNCAIAALAGEVQRAASRIHHLVAAVKRFTYMDKPGVPEPVDIEQGLRDTVLLLDRKARDRSVSVTLEVAPNLPRARGFGGELNQVWANLVDNALDAAPASGHVTITAAPGPLPGSVVVRIVDDGPGIPAEIRARIFDPFFTTKAVGQGTGLGLDIARQLTRHSGGELELESRPGHTEFTVTLPAV
jgi:signal transduction histidine kinase